MCHTVKYSCTYFNTDIFQASIGKEYWKSSCDIFHEPCFFRHCSEATFVMAILDSHASELFSEIRWSVHTWAWGIFWEILHFTSTLLDMKWYKKVQHEIKWHNYFYWRFKSLVTSESPTHEKANPETRVIIAEIFFGRFWPWFT